jgi:GC-rich sequence DNA-binding factor
MISNRRTQDDQDDLTAVFGDLSFANGAEFEKVDEMGRAIPSINDPFARRQRRVDRNTRHSQRPSSQEDEGFSTDSDLPSPDEDDYRAAIRTLHTKSKAILTDVRSEEFRDPRKGLGRWFAGWRERYPDSYEGAFGGLGMISAWEFWTRLEMLGWDPVSEPRSFDAFMWYGALYNYSRPRESSQINGSGDGEDGMDEDIQLGAEGDLASAMVSTIIPRICKLVESGAFDPYSAKHVRTITDLSEQVDIYATKEKIDFLTKTVTTVFREATENTIQPLTPLLTNNVGNPMRFDPEAIPARRRFLMKRYKLLTNLCRWRKHVGEKFGLGELVVRLVAECMQPVARGGWEVCGEEIMQKVSEF